MIWKRYYWTRQKHKTHTYTHATQNSLKVSLSIYYSEYGLGDDLCICFFTAFWVVLFVSLVLLALLFWRGRGRVYRLFAWQYTEYLDQ